MLPVKVSRESIRAAIRADRGARGKIIGISAHALTNLTVAEEALSLSPEDRAALARLLIQSLEVGSRTEAEIKADLKSRLEQLLSKKDEGLAFHEVFGRPS